MCSVGVVLMMGALLGCGDDLVEATPPSGSADSGWTAPDVDDTSSPGDKPIGSTVGALQPIDHEFASSVMAENLAAHIDELDEAPSPCGVMRWHRMS